MRKTSTPDQLFNFPTAQQAIEFLKNNKDAAHATLFGQPILHYTLLLWPKSGLKATHLAILLIENGADVNSKNQEGETPLMIAAQNGNEFMVDFLLENGAVLSDDLLNRVSAKLPRLIRKLLNENENTIKQAQLDRLLNDATNHFNIDLIKYLIGKGANLKKILSEKNLIDEALTALGNKQANPSTIKEYFEFLLNRGVVCKLNQEKQQQFARVLIDDSA